VPSRFLESGPSDRCTMLPAAMIPAKTRLKQFGSILLGGPLARSWGHEGVLPQPIAARRSMWRIRNMNKNPGKRFVDRT
jgi:hypothetical protein